MFFFYSAFRASQLPRICLHHLICVWNLEEREEADRMKNMIRFSESCSVSSLLLLFALCRKHLSDAQADTSRSLRGHVE